MEGKREEGKWEGHGREEAVRNSAFGRGKGRLSKIFDILPKSVFLDEFSMSKFYITTAIDYVNGSPHLGHAYEKVLTDVIARFRRLMGDDVYFRTGVDEHGQKVQQSAKAKGVLPQ